MDGPKVNVKFYEEIFKSWQKAVFHTLIDICSCSLHVVHGSLKTGIDKSSWKIKETMKGAFYVLRDKPARRKDYTAVTKSTTFPFYFCATRLGAIGIIWYKSSILIICQYVLVLSTGYLPFLVGIFPSLYGWKDSEKLVLQVTVIIFSWSSRGSSHAQRNF